jgi:hypothetical protein
LRTGYRTGYVVFEIQHLSAISRTACHPSLSITSWSSFSQRSYLGNPLNCPFYPKIFHATETLIKDSHNNVFQTN